MLPNLITPHKFVLGKFCHSIERCSVYLDLRENPFLLHSVETESKRERVLHTKPKTQHRTKPAEKEEKTGRKTGKQRWKKEAAETQVVRFLAAVFRLQPQNSKRFLFAFKFHSTPEVFGQRLSNGIRSCARIGILVFYELRAGVRAKTVGSREATRLRRPDVMDPHAIPAFLSTLPAPNGKDLIINIFSIAFLNAHN